MKTGIILKNWGLWMILLICNGILQDYLKYNDSIFWFLVVDIALYVIGKSIVDREKYLKK